MTTATDDPWMVEDTEAKLRECELLLAGLPTSFTTDADRQRAQQIHALVRAYWLQIDAQWHAWPEEVRQTNPQIRHAWRSLAEELGWL